MRRTITLVGGMLVLLSAAGLAFTAEVGGQDADKELQKFQGTWVMVSGERDGAKLADEAVSRSKITYEGNKISLITPHQSSETIVAEIVKMDPTKSLKEMHFVRKKGPNAGKTVVGIYEFEGNDQYKFAFDPSGATILKEFVTKAGTGHMRHTWKRVKP
ncbi:MAG: TIGR03067 domain-containing protein [Desulfomonile tiedjei]|nr:TIGR03067 domain-containing protein [Desulfomonile tiedjei]